MGKGRLEAFSDGVFAIIITIMVLELKAPFGTGANALRPVLPDFLCYVLSFVFIAIYWNNHHHTFQVVHKVKGSILWANTHLLFWLSLIPFVTNWMGKNNFLAGPVALYGCVLLMSAIAYAILIRTLIGHEGKHSTLALAIGNDAKGNISLAMYAAAIPLAFLNRWASIGLYILVSILWLVPDRRIEKVID